MATLVATGHGKLSENILADAIVKFYVDKHSAPAGVAKSALEAWAGKQAFGLRILCQKFRKLNWQAPGSWSTKIAEAKEKLRKATQDKESWKKNKPGLGGEDSGAATFLEEAGDHAFAWDQLEMRLEEAVANEKLATEKGEDSNSATGPLRTPDKKVPKVVAGVKSLNLHLPEKAATSDFALFGSWDMSVYLRNFFQVLRAMASASGGPEPFDARGWEEEGAEEQKPAEPAVSRAGKKPKAKAEGKKKSKAKNKKTKEEEEETTKEKPNQVDDQVPEDAGAPMEALDQENLLDLLRDHFGECQTPPPRKEPPPEVTPVKYSPKAFAEAQHTFIKNKRAADSISYAEARNAWMISNERADMLNTLSHKELKRRRFL